MDKEMLFRYCEYQYRLFHMPVHIFENGKCIRSFNFTDSLFSEGQEQAIVKEFYSPEKKTRMQFLYSFLLDGVVFSEKENIFIFYGYSRSSELTEQNVHDYLLCELHDPNMLTDDFLKDCMAYLRRMPRMSPGQFSTILLSTYIFLNGKEFEGELYHEELTENIGLFHELEEEGVDEEVYRFYYDREQLMLFYVRHGMFENIAKDCKKNKSFNLFGGSAYDDSWKSTKVRTFQSVALLTRTAIKAGGTLKLWYQLQKYYSEKVSQCSSMDELNELRYSMLIDYAKRVFALKYKAIENQDIFEIVQYIQAHILERIKLDDISEAMHISKSRLCTKFKQSMGIGLNEFINELKIDKAKQYLRFTSLSLVEISGELGFSTQSYFQQVFRQKTGLTPVEYKNQNT